MAELRIERNHPGKTSRYWRDGDTVVVQIGRDLHPWKARRLIQDAEREYGIRRHGGLPIVLPIPAALRQLVRNHPTTTAAVTGVLALGVAAGAVYGTGQLGDDNTRGRRRPPAVAGPAPTPGPSTATPAPSRSATPAPRVPPSRRTGPTVYPGEPSRPVRPTAGTAPVADQPAVRPSPTPGGTGGTPPASKPPPATPPAATPPPSTPPAAGGGGDFCLVHLAALGILDVSLCL